jgi:hypothetical protein
MIDHSEKLFNDGYTIINSCIDNKLLKKIKDTINFKLSDINEIADKKPLPKLEDNFKKAILKKSQFHVQKILSKYLMDLNLIDEIFKSPKLLQELTKLLGPDLEYMTDFEMAINSRYTNKKDTYLIKKYHQEFWSGMGIEALQLWIPIVLAKDSGTMELIKNSDKWGHIPHENKEPVFLPKKIEKIVLQISEGSVAALSALTLHKTIKNESKNIRIALPITVKNTYYPNTNNSDLFNFRKIKKSYFTRLRKTLGNSHFSPFRTKKKF